MMPIAASRSLLLPGETLPPISHFGATLARHVTMTGLRYALHQLGLPMPERSLITIVELRPYLDGRRVAQLLDDRPAGRLVARALLEPEGAETEPPPPRLRGAIAFHRARLKLVGPPKPKSALETNGTDRTPDATWEHFLDALRTVLPRLNEALLSELLSALDRRQRRGHGETLAAVQSRHAHRYLRRSKPRLDALGPPDLREPSWAEGAPAAVAAENLADDLPPDGDPRGRFREWFRIALEPLRPIYLDYAAAAVERGVLDGVDDAFFIPFEVAHDLAAQRQPGWLPGAVRSNRREHETALGAAQAPPDRLLHRAEPLTTLGRRANWSRAPLALLA